MTTSRFDTAQTIIYEAAVELGLSADTSAPDVWASTNPIYLQLRTLINSCGKELAALWKWPSLIKPHSFTATAASAPALYGINTLPTDFDEYVPDTGWNQTDDERIVDCSTQVWEGALATTLSGSLVSFAYIDADRLLLYPDASGDTVTFRYHSRYWVKGSGQSTLTAATCTANGDTPYLDPLLLKRLLKLRYLQAKKMPHAEEQADFDITFDIYKGKHLPAQTLRLDGGGTSGRFIDRLNVPDTGLGS